MVCAVEDRQVHVGSSIVGNHIHTERADMSVSSRAAADGGQQKQPDAEAHRLVIYEAMGCLIDPCLLRVAWLEALRGKQRPPSLNVVAHRVVTSAAHNTTIRKLHCPEVFHFFASMQR